MERRFSVHVGYGKSINGVVAYEHGMFVRGSSRTFKSRMKADIYAAELGKSLQEKGAVSYRVFGS